MNDDSILSHYVTRTKYQSRHNLCPNVGQVQNTLKGDPVCTSYIRDMAYSTVIQ